MKSKFLSLTIVALAASLLCGCVRVPTTKIKGNIGGQTFSGEFPKDSDLTELEVSSQTNGTVKLRIGTLKTRMNPDVIGQTAAGQAAVTKEIMAGSASIAGEVTQRAIEAAKK